jgi:alkanesulfonate monooxygenase SsuD/methylene tetrahydromethanopterin reductase-like flavin-dependent oxidoreductase (luciferase family)
MLLPPGYMSLASMKDTMRMRKETLGAQHRLTIDELMASGTVVVGSPRTVRDQLARLMKPARTISSPCCSSACCRMI